jgi:hypothetical protein
MGLREWWHRLSKHEDDAALERAEAEQLETPEERKLSEADVPELEADAKAGFVLRETPEEAERLADADDSP